MISLVVIATAASLLQPVYDYEVEMCESAVRDYTNAADELAMYLPRYINCLQSSAGRDDCSIEFRRVKNAQLSFEMAVSAVSRNCPR